MERTPFSLHSKPIHWDKPVWKIERPWRRGCREGILPARRDRSDMQIPRWLNEGRQRRCNSPSTRLRCLDSDSRPYELAHFLLDHIQKLGAEIPSCLTVVIPNWQSLDPRDCVDDPS